ncbi:MAG: hypothetical protein COB73_03350 [Flavobacteriaceae bacterium]|nr:MAG: hypothetical protein COB73_03350 [Flavobacteriaceae bacterium]
MHSQTTLYFKDTISNKPSSYIMVLNEDKEIIGTSNEFGKIHFDDNVNLTNKLFLESIFYEKKVVLKKEIKNNTTILLNPLVNLLDEVEIENKKRYPVLTVYYRIYNTVDGVLNSFFDYEIKYVIKKNSTQRIVLNNRILDTISNENYKKDKRPFWRDKLKNKPVFETLNSNYHLINDEKKGVIGIVDKKTKEGYGTIKIELNSNNKRNIIIDFERKSENSIGIYREEYNNSNLLKTTFKDLRYRSEIFIRKVTPLYIKYDPLLKGKKEMFNKREFFIQSVEYITKEEYKKIMRLGYKDVSVSHYTKEFWKNLENFTPLDTLIEKQLNTILVERK